MTSFFTTLLRLLSAIWHGREDPEFKAMFKLLLIVLISGVAFYTQVEGWSYLDALYFSVITMATIGYGDLSPVTTSGKIFTMFFALASVGIFVSLAAKIGAILLARERLLADKIKHIKVPGIRQQGKGEHGDRSVS